MAAASLLRFFLLKALIWLWFPHVLLSVRPIEEHQDQLTVKVDHRGRQESPSNGNTTITAQPLAVGQTAEVAEPHVDVDVIATVSTEKEDSVGVESATHQDIGDEADALVYKDLNDLTPSQQRLVPEKEEDVDDFLSVTAYDSKRRLFDCRDTCPEIGSCQPARMYDNMDRTHPYFILCNEHKSRQACAESIVPDYGGCDWQPVVDPPYCGFLLQAWLSPMQSFQNVVPTAVEAPVCCPCSVKAITNMIIANLSETPSWTEEPGSEDILAGAKSMGLTDGQSKGLMMGPALAKLLQFRDTGQFTSTTSSEWRVLDAAKRKAVFSATIAAQVPEEEYGEECVSEKVACNRDEDCCGTMACVHSSGNTCQKVGHNAQDRPYHEVMRQIFFQRYQRQLPLSPSETPEARKEYREAVEKSWPEFSLLKAHELLRDTCPSVIPVYVDLKLLEEPPAGYPDQLNRDTYPQLKELVTRVSQGRAAGTPTGDGPPEGSSGSYLAQMMTLKIRQSMTCAGLLDKDTAGLRKQEQVCRLVACGCRPRVKLFGSGTYASEEECSAITQLNTCMNHGRDGSGADWPANMPSVGVLPNSTAEGCGDVRWCDAASMRELESGCNLASFKEMPADQRRLGGYCGRIHPESADVIAIEGVTKEDCDNGKLQMFLGHCWLGRNAVQGKCVWSSDLQLALEMSQAYRVEDWARHDKSEVYGRHSMFDGLEFVEYTLPTAAENAYYGDSKSADQARQELEGNRLNYERNDTVVAQTLYTLTSCLGGLVGSMQADELLLPWGFSSHGSTSAFVQADTGTLEATIPSVTARNWGTLKFRYWKWIGPGTPGFEDGLGGGRKLWKQQGCPLLKKEASPGGNLHPGQLVEVQGLESGGLNGLKGKLLALDEDQLSNHSDTRWKVALDKGNEVVEEELISSANLVPVSADEEEDDPFLIAEESVVLVALMRQYVLKTQSVDKVGLEAATKSGWATMCSAMKPKEDGDLTIEKKYSGDELDMRGMLQQQTVIRATSTMNFTFNAGEGEAFTVTAGCVGTVLHVDDSGAAALVAWDDKKLSDPKQLPKASLQDIEIVKGGGTDPTPANIFSCVNNCYMHESSGRATDRDMCQSFWQFCQQEAHKEPPQSAFVSAKCDEWRLWYSSQIYAGCGDGVQIVDDDAEQERVAEACKRRRVLDLKAAALFDKHFAGREELNLVRTCNENSCGTTAKDPLRVETAEATRYRTTFPAAHGETEEARTLDVEEACPKGMSDECSAYAAFVEEEFKCSANDGRRISCFPDNESVATCTWYQGRRGNTRAHVEDPSADPQAAIFWMDKKKDTMRCVSASSRDHLQELQQEAAQSNTGVIREPSCTWNGFTRCLQLSWSSLLSPVCNNLGQLYESMLSSGKVYIMSPQVQALLSNGNAWSAPTFVSQAYIGSASFADALIDINRNDMYAAHPAELAHGVAGGMVAALTVKALWSSDRHRAGPTLWKQEVAGRHELSHLEKLMDKALQPAIVLGCVLPKKRLKLWAYVGPASPVFQATADSRTLLQQQIGIVDEPDGVMPYMDSEANQHGKGYRIPGGWIFDMTDAQAIEEVSGSQCEEAVREHFKPQAMRKSRVTSAEFDGTV